MIDTLFEKFLINEVNIISKDKAVRTRMSKAKAVERKLEESLDYIVADDIRMYKSLIKINLLMNNYNGCYSNVLRKYYIFKNKKSFPQLLKFEEIIKL